MGQTAPEAPVAPAPEPAVTAAPERAACGDPAEEGDDQLTDAAPAEAPAAVPSDAQASAAPVPVEAHCAQNAGDQQYQDPFAGSEPPGGNGGGNGSGNSAQNNGATQGEAPTSVPTQDPATGTVDPTATAAAADEQLPNTGLGLAGLLALGVPLVLGGVAVRLRLA
jgi:hypothetical protein